VTIERATSLDESDHKVARARNRVATEADLLGAARRLVERDGVLAGLNLQEVANEAGVNRGLIYQYFGSRERLLKAALADLQWDRDAVLGQEYLPFAERRRRIFSAALDNATLFKLEALLAITNDDDLRLFPHLDVTVQELERDRRDGHLPQDADGVALHVLTAATYLGYAIFREAMARDTGIAEVQLDERIRKAFDQMLSALTREAAASEAPPAS
jgi:AcrR family transcriptional regulator